MERKTRPEPQPKRRAPCAQAQAQAFQKTLPKDVEGGLRAFTAGRAIQKPKDANLATMALAGVAMSTTPQGRWLRVPCGDLATHEAFLSLQTVLCHAFPTRAKIVVVPGQTTATMGIVFGDASVVFARQGLDGLDLYPATFYLRTRARGWSAIVRMGKKDEDARLIMARAHSAIKHTNAWSCAGHTLAKPQDLGFWGQALREDVDRFAPIFDTLIGQATMPTSWKRAIDPSSAWPLFLPHPGVCDTAHAMHQRTINEAVTWLAAAVSSWTKTSKPNDLDVQIKVQDVFLLLSDNAVHVSCTRLGAWRPREIPNASLATLFPRGLARRLLWAAQSPTGLKLTFDAQKKPWVKPWGSIAHRADIQRSGHATLLAFAKSGIPTASMHQAWMAMLTP